MGKMMEALLLKHLKNYNDPHKTGIANIKADLATEEKTVVLINTLTYPLNDSVQTVSLDNPRNTLDYWVETEVLETDGNVGGIIISNKQLAGFKVEFTGNATRVTIRCRIRGGIYPNLPPLGTDLDDCSWAEISKISEAGLAADYFSVGDCKAVHLQGTIGTLDIDAIYYAFILGFDHNHEIEGKGISFGTFKTAKTNGVDVALIDSSYASSAVDGAKFFNMNHSGNTNIGGWQGCDLRYDILGSVDINDGQNASLATISSPVPNTLMAAFPASLRQVLKPITKYTDNYGNTNNDPTKVTPTVEYLPLLSEYEMLGARTYANETEQTYQEQYDYYRSGNSKLKYRHNNPTAVARWWGRSPNYDSSVHFCDVHPGYETAFRNYANESYGLSPVFLV